MPGRPPLAGTAAFLLVLIAALCYASVHLPPQADYRMLADEGTYFTQASAIRLHGPGALAGLGDAYVRDPARQIVPPPLRVGHLAAAALALRIDPSMRSLSVLSMIAYAALCVTVFLFAGRLWDWPIATVAGMFTAVSPLGWGLARRALMDTDYLLFSTLTLCTLLLWLATGRARHFVMFAAVLFWCVLVKETAWVYVPFAAALMLAARLTGRGAVHARHLVITLVAVPAAVLVVYMLAFGGPGNAVSVIRVAYH